MTPWTTLAAMAVLIAAAVWATRRRPEPALDRRHRQAIAALARIAHEQTSKNPPP